MAIGETNNKAKVWIINPSDRRRQLERLKEIYGTKSLVVIFAKIDAEITFKG